MKNPIRDGMIALAAFAAAAGAAHAQAPDAHKEAIDKAHQLTVPMRDATTAFKDIGKTDLSVDAYDLTNANKCFNAMGKEPDKRDARGAWYQPMPNGDSCHALWLDGVHALEFTGADGYRMVYARGDVEELKFNSGKFKQGPAIIKGSRMAGSHLTLSEAASALPGLRKATTTFFDNLKR